MKWPDFKFSNFNGVPTYLQSSSILEIVSIDKRKSRKFPSNCTKIQLQNSCLAPPVTTQNQQDTAKWPSLMTLKLKV